MIKAVLALAVFASVPAAYAADFDLQRLDAAAVAAPVPGALAAEPQPAPAEVPQDLVYRFDRLKNDLWRLESDTTWLRSDLDRLESTARRISMGNSPDHFFQNDLQRKAWEMQRFDTEAQRLRREVNALLQLAVKSDVLNRKARDIDMDASTLLNRFQFEIENAATRLEWTVRGAKPELVGYNAQWNAMDISRNARQLAWNIRDLRYDAQDLVRRTQP